MKHQASSSVETDTFALNNEVYSLGEDAFREGKFSEARKYFKLAIEYWSEDSDSWWALGNCLDKLNSPQKAEQCFRKALEHADNDAKPDIYFDLGNSLYDQEKYQEALASYRHIPKGCTVWWQSTINSKLATQMLSPE